MTVGVSNMTALRSSAVGDWEVCGDAFFSRELLYDMVWDDVDLESRRVSAAPYGGPIAVVRDERRMVVVTSGSIKPVIRIFAASGRQLGTSVWDKGRLMAWGWSSSLELIMLDDTGRVVVLSMHGEKLREFSMGMAVEKQGVSKGLVYGGGIVVLTQQPHQLWAVTDLQEPRPVALAALPASLAQAPGPSCMTVLEPHFTASGALEVLLGSNQGVCQVDDASALEHTLPGAATPTPPPAAPAAPGQPRPAPPPPPPPGPTQHVRHLAASPDGSFVAAFAMDGHIHVFSADFTKHLSDFDSKADQPPSSLLWCGSDAVVVHWPELLLVVGPFGDHASWPQSGERLVVVQEVDGVRLLSSQRHELLRKVPRCIADIQRPGSTAPAALLWEARDLFEQHNVRADRILRGLSPTELRAAVADCIEAATLELNVRQKALLRAACFGGAFCMSAAGDDVGGGGRAAGPGPGPLQDAYYDACCKLRVLNALREPRPGIPLTLPQLEALTLPAVVQRLVAYHEWLLAYRIAGTMQPRGANGVTALPSTGVPGLPPTAGSPVAAAGGALRPGANARSNGAAVFAQPDASPQELVLLQWACAKISAPSSSSLSDAELKEQITAKLPACPGVHFAPLAAHAQSIGRRRLALRLLEEETSCSLQVPLLLSLSIGAPPSSSSSSAALVVHRTEPLSEEDGDILLRALRKAIESGDTDLVYLVLFHIYHHRSLTEFWTMVSSRTLARNLFIKFCAAKEPELLETLLNLDSQAPELAQLQLKRCLSQYVAAHAQRQANDTALLRLVTALSDVAAKYSTSRDHVFQAKAISEFAQLRREQARLERETGQHLFVGLSLVDTMRACIRLGHNKHAANLKRAFNVGDKRFTWLKVLTLSEEHDWNGLEDFAAERKSLIGWEPFLELAKKHEAPREVQARIIHRFPDSKVKAELFTSIDCPRDAAEVAAKLRDGDLLAKIQGLVPAASPAGLAIAQIKDRFQATFR